jgi:hypothetical protein
MKKLINIILIFLVIILASSCTITRKGVPTVPMNFQINLDMTNLEYLGEVTGTSTQAYFLGIPLGGRKYTAGVSMPTGIFLPPIPHSRGMNNAMYDALLSKPDADFVLPVSYVTVRQQMFLGSKVKLTLKTKAFKLKTK